LRLIPNSLSQEALIDLEKQVVQKMEAVVEVEADLID
jgi:hypothetical protein